MTDSVKKLLLLVAVFILTLIAASYDILNIGNDLTSAVKVWYFIPFIGYSVYVLTKGVYSRRADDPNVKTEKIKSLIRSTLTIIGTIITLAAALNLQIPFINEIRSVFEYLGQNVDIAANAILALTGIVMTVISHFKNPERFEGRGTKIIGKKLSI